MNNNLLETSVLGIISSKPMHGYEVYKSISDLSGIGIVWKIKIGKLYSILNRFEMDGLIKAKVTKVGNRPSRNEYSITPAGEERFQTWLETPVEHGRDFRIIFLLKLYFSRLKGAETAIQLILNQLKVCKNWLEEKKEFSQNIIKGNELEKNDFKYLVDKYRCIQTRGYIEWLEWCKAKIQRG